MSGALLALTLLGNASKLGGPFVAAAFVLGATLLALGLTTFQRLLEAAIEDARYGQGINRIRQYYLRAAPHLRPFFIQSGHDDLPSVMTNMAVEPGRAQLFVTGASGVAVIDSVLAGGLGAWGRPPTPLAVGLAGAVGGLALWLHTRHQPRLWARFEAWSRPQFPAQPGADSVTAP